MTIGLPGLGYKSQGNLNRGQICIGDYETDCNAFINLFKGTTLSGFTAPASPANLDSNGYPVSTFLNGGVSYTFVGTPASLGPYKMSWPATRSNFKIVFFGQTATSSAHTNCTIISDGGNNWSVIGDGTNAGSVTFSFASVNANMLFYFDGGNGFGGTQPYSLGSGDISLILTSNQSLFDAGEIFTAGFVSTMQALAPKTLRMMPVINNIASNRNAEVKWKYRIPPTHFSYRAACFNSTNYVGSITNAGSGVYPSSVDQLTAPAASDSPLSGWVDGEMFVGNVQAAVSGFNITGVVSGTGSKCKVTVSGSPVLTTNLAIGQQIWIAGVNGTTEVNGIQTILSIDDTTHFTVDVPFVHTFVSGGANQAGTAKIAMTGKSGVAKFVAAASGGPIISLSTGLTTFHYDALLDRAIQCDNTGSLPMEIQCAMANKLKCDLWSNLPSYCDADYVTNWATTARDYLNPASVFYAEYSNEMDFNFQFPQTGWAFSCGAAMGFPHVNRDWYHYKVKKYLGDIVGLVWRGRSNQLRRVMCLQYVPSNTDVNMWKGSGLSSVGYDTSPNRPIDAVECIAYAPYAGGRNLSGGADINQGASAAQASWFQILVNLWDGGSTAAAIAMVDDDIRQGRHSVQNLDPATSGTTFKTPSAHGFTAAQTCVQFQVTGGTAYSGVATNQTYRVLTTPTSTTFTIQDVGQNTINAGSAGTGTTTVGNCGKSFFSNQWQTCWTILGFANTVTPFWEALATGFDSDRPAGMLPLKVCWYEGALELVCPDITGLGLTGTNPTASVNAAIDAWSASTSARDTYIAYCRQSMGTDASQVSYKTSNNHVLSIANLTLAYPGLNQYAFMNGNILTGTKNKLFDGFASFSANG